MNAQATDGVSANPATRRLLRLAASILGMLVLAFGVAPGTVLASSATDVYTEQPPPVTPNTNKGGNNGTTNGGTSNNGDNTGSNGDTSTGGGSGSSGNSGSSGSGSGTSGDDYKAGKKYSNGQYDPATDSDQGSPAKQEGSTDDTDDSTIAVTPAGGDDGDDGGSALPVIIAILVGVPLIGAGVYYGWTRYRVRDDEAKDRLKSALGGEQPPSAH